MCGRYLLTASKEGLASWFGFTGGPAVQARYNIAPSQSIPVVRLTPEGKERELAFLRWGLIPAWAKDLSFGARTINARSETIADKPAFRTAFRRQRCLIPADGFYEWKKAGKNKQPYVIRPADGHPLSFAGLWDRWQSPEGEVLETATIITTAANEVLRPLHERMPAILPREHYALWLDPQQQKDNLLQLLMPYPDRLLTLYPVTPWVSDAHHEGERCLEPATTLFA
jgi:putative SOS response-associated peptidase YedK